MRFLTFATTSFIAFASFFCVVVAADAADNDATVVTPKLRALLISLESYDNAELSYVDADLNNLLDALARLGCSAKVIRDETSPNRDDMKAAFEREVSEWCARLHSDETAILYLAGHGLKGPDDKLYIPMLNFFTTPEARRFQDAAVPYSWIREKLEAADCQSRVVFIDACHSGAASRTLDSAISTASPLNEFVAPIARNDAAPSRITVLASSATDQESYLWAAEQSSLFTYWLVKGISGYADQNGDFSLSLSELGDYVVENVQAVSQTPSERMKLQTPVLHNAQANASLAFPRLARKTDDATKYCAEFLIRALKKLKSDLGADGLTVVFPETFPTGKGQDATADAVSYGVYPQTFVEKLKNRLTEGDGGDFLSFLETEDALDEDALANLASDDSLHAVVSGRIWRESDALAVRVVLTTYKKNANKDGVIKLTKQSFEKIYITPEDRALLGDAFVLAPPQESADADQETPATNQETPDAEPSASSEEPRLVVASEGAVLLEEYEEAEEVAEQVAENRNPIDDPTSPFKIQIYVLNPVSKKYELREGRTVDGKHYVPLDKGERFAVRLLNDYPDADGCYVRLFVDGLNTLAYASADARAMRPVPAASSAASTGPQAKAADAELAPRVDDVEKAATWYLPRKQKAQIDGFTLKTRGDKKAVKAPFVVEEYSPDSFVALQNVDGSRVGLVTAIFSVPKRVLSLSDDEPMLKIVDGASQSQIAALVVPPSETYRYRWERRKTNESEWTPVPGRVDKVYPLSEDDVDCFLRVVVQGQDAKLGEISVETTAAVQRARAKRHSVAPDFTQKIVVELEEAERLEEQTHTAFQIYHVSPETFQKLTEND